MNPSSEREQVRENGPFTAENWRGEIVVQSEDFHHDVTLKISGDFGDPGVKLAYAQHLAEILNLGIASRAALSTQPQQAGWKMLKPLDLNQFAEVCYAAHIDFCLDKFPSEERALEYHYIGLLNRMHAAPLTPVPGQEGGE